MDLKTNLRTRLIEKKSITQKVINLYILFPTLEIGVKQQQLEAETIKQLCGIQSSAFGKSSKIYLLPIFYLEIFSDFLSVLSKRG